MATKHQLTEPTAGITCHAWNGDKSMIALCPNNNEIHIYGGCDTSSWQRLHVLPEHDLVVSGLDWSSVTNKIVSCSHDRNAFVWTYDSDSRKWVPALVILRIERAALDVKWSLDGLRFACTSGAKCVPVCTYEETNDWWNGQLLATGSADFKCRVFSTFDSTVDAAPSQGNFEKPLEFGEAYCEFSSHGWVTGVAWSPTGESLCYAGHDSSISVVTFSPGGRNVLQTIRFRDLPLTCVTFVSERAIVGAGHDFNPMVFTSSGGGWTYLDRLEKKPEKAQATNTGGVAAARALFQSKAKLGQDSTQDADTLWTSHEGAITDIAVVSPTKLSTAGLDGKIVVWDLPQLSIAMASLGL